MNSRGTFFCKRNRKINGCIELKQPEANTKGQLPWFMQRSKFYLDTPSCDGSSYVNGTHHIYFLFTG